MFAASFSRPKDAPLKARSEEISPLAFSFPRKLEARMSPPKLGAGSGFDLRQIEEAKGIVVEETTLFVLTDAGVFDEAERGGRVQRGQAAPENDTMWADRFHCRRNLGAIHDSRRLQKNINCLVRGGYPRAPVCTAHTQKDKFMGAVGLGEMQSYFDTGRVGSVQKDGFLVAATGIENLIGQQGMQRLIGIISGQQDGHEFFVGEHIFDGLDTGVHAIDMRDQTAIQPLALVERCLEDTIAR